MHARVFGVSALSKKEFLIKMGAVAIVEKAHTEAGGVGHSRRG